MKRKFLKSAAVALVVTLAFSGLPLSAYSAETDAYVAESVVESATVDNNTPEQTEPATQESTQATEATETTNPPVADYPEVTGFTNTANGTKVSWSEYSGAAKYTLFVFDGTKWRRVGDSTTLSYTHTSLKNGTKYLYTVRALDKNNSFISDYCRQGYENTFYAPPTISSLENIYGGVSVKWSKYSGIDSYRVYRKTKNSGWKFLGDADGSSYTDKNASSGTSYTYTIRCLDKDGKLVSSYNNGKSITYVKSPSISKIENTVTGSKISWSKCEGAAKYRVFYLDSSKKWRSLGATASTSFTHDKLTTGTKYTYTVRCLDSKGNFISGYNKTGVSNTFLKAPTISSLTNIDGGVEVKWGKLNGADGYRIYRKTKSSNWSVVGDSDSTSFVDKKATSGTNYSYTVRCLDKNGKLVSSYNNGKSITYVKAPSISKIENTATGSKISWSKCSGAAKYRVFYLDSNKSWKSIGTTTSTSFTHDKLKTGTTYTYTVRCLDSKSNFVSGYNKSGKSNLFLAPPTISGVSKAENGNLIKWNSVSGVAGYRLYRKTVGSSWSVLADVTSGNSYVDTSAKNDNIYSYTLRCLDKNGSLISSYISDTKYYYNGSLANGKVSANGETYYFSNGLFRSGLQTINGNKYYYNSSGVLQKNGIVGSDKDGWYYADKNGKIDFTYSNAVTQNGKDWIVRNGKATKVSTKSDRTLFRAMKIVAKITDNSMSKSQKLKVCYNYVKNSYTELNPRIPHYTGNDWPIIYANDMFVDGAGNCFSYAAAFAYMAKAIGYENVYCCNSGGHGWAEIDGLIYDPEWSRHHSKEYYALSYNTTKDPNYKGAIAPGYSWMHVKI